MRSLLNECISHELCYFVSADRTIEGILFAVGQPISCITAELNKLFVHCKGKERSVIVLSLFFDFLG
jgi:hypothetical protein